MLKKHCLFCDQIVPIEPKGEYDKYAGCYCSPEGSYELLRESYDSISSFSYQMKRDIFPIVSAYIRELTDRDERVTLSADDLDRIANSPNIPVTLEEKGIRLLQYLYRHSEAPGESVVIHPLSHSYNLTYSLNLQELVYIIDQLTSGQSIVREGMSFKLTETGWNEAAARAGGRKLKPCSVILGAGAKWSAEWEERVLPKLEQFGYLPQIYNHTGNAGDDDHSFHQLADCKLVIADLSDGGPEVYFAAGYALGLNIPIHWTVNSSHAEQLTVQPDIIRPLVWDTPDELAAALQQILNK